MNPTHEQWLVELTATPTAAGREDRIVAWVKHWAANRPGVSVEADVHGNLTLRDLRPGDLRGDPIYYTAHMDHPAFVVEQVSGPRSLVAEFRGGVNPPYFPNTPVLLHHATRPAQRGAVKEYVSRSAAYSFGGDDGRKLLRIELDQDATASPGDVLTWDVGPARINDGRLHTTACDDVAGVVAALAAFDVVLHAQPPGGARPDVRILLTRAEETGFLGAIAACKTESIPRNARLLCLENSKSFPESPIGGGPIVRVGDLTSTFDADLTYRVGQIAKAIAAEDPTFRWQRKLMPGGTCEASAFQAYGYISTCLCLPLGNYHNMNEATGKIDAETISIADFHGLVRLLAEIARRLDDPAQTPALRKRLDDLFEQRKHILAT